MTLLSTQFIELFRQELYSVNSALLDEHQLENVFEKDILATKDFQGAWTKEYSVVPIGAIGGRDEAEDIPEHNMVMGYTCYGAVDIEASVRVDLSKKLNQKAREFKGTDGKVDEEGFAKHLADDVGRACLLRRNQRWQKLSSDIFNLGGIPAGNAHFNQFTRCGGYSDVTNSNLIYDGAPLFALPGNEHTSYVTGATTGTGSKAVGTYVDLASTYADTGGYFNAFILPPSYWALKRVVTHYIFNMQFDEQDERYDYMPDTLLVSSFNIMRWNEILQSRFIEPTAAGSTTNRENVFQMAEVQGAQLRLVASPYLLPNTWYVGKAKSRGIRLLNPTDKDELWAFWRNESNRVYSMSFEDEWGFIISNWRNWVAGAISTDGETAPTFNDTDEDDWDTIPDGI